LTLILAFFLSLINAYSPSGDVMLEFAKAA